MEKKQSIFLYLFYPPVLLLESNQFQFFLTFTSVFPNNGFMLLILGISILEIYY